MRFRFHVPILILALAITPVLGGCAARAAISSAPTVADQSAVRAVAGRIADGIYTTNEITKGARRFHDSLPVPNADKVALNDAILAVWGTTEKPGPMHALIQAISSATSEASLRSSVETALKLIDPYVARLEASTNLGIAGFGASARAAMLFARNYVTPSPTQ